MNKKHEWTKKADKTICKFCGALMNEFTKDTTCTVLKREEWRVK